MVQQRALFSADLCSCETPFIEIIFDCNETEMLSTSAGNRIFVDMDFWHFLYTVFS